LLRPYGSTLCLPSAHLVHIYDGKYLSNQKQNKYHLDIWPNHQCFLVGKTFHAVLHICLERRLKYLCKTFTKLAVNIQHTHTHTRCSSRSFIVKLSANRWKVCEHAQFSGCSSTTNAYSQTAQIAVFLPTSVARCAHYQKHALYDGWRAI
jgi:hypothetical protein